MTEKAISGPDADWQAVVAFHGHSCPGLAIGYRVAKAALRELGQERAPDEELVAVVENDACGVDAVQFLTGCTLGKGNLIYRDYGKQVYTFYRRGTGQALRIAVRGQVWRRDPRHTELRSRVFSGNATPEEREEFARAQEETTRRILEAPEEQLLELRELAAEPPERARIFGSVTCAFCGEAVSEHRARWREGRPACIPCAGEYTRGW
ncbi:MAG: FmdE family protein [Moorellales bacterium]